MNNLKLALEKIKKECGNNEISISYIEYEATQALKDYKEQGRMYTYDDMLDAMGWAAAMDNKRPVHELKEEAIEYIKIKDIRKRLFTPTETKEVSEDPIEKYQSLFDAIQSTGGVALESEMQDIIRIVHRDFPITFTPKTK